MKKSQYTVALSILILSVSVMTTGCTEDDTEPEDYDEYAVWIDDSADFSSYKTFNFVDFPEEQLEKVPEYVVNNNKRIHK